MAEHGRLRAVLATQRSARTANRRSENNHPSGNSILNVIKQALFSALPLQGIKGEVTFLILEAQQILT